MERETRFELATPALARRCSTAELFPHTQLFNSVAPFPVTVKAFVICSRLLYYNNKSDMQCQHFFTNFLHKLHINRKQCGIPDVIIQIHLYTSTIFIQKIIFSIMPRYMILDYQQIFNQKSICLTCIILLQWQQPIHLEFLVPQNQRQYQTSGSP